MALAKRAHFQETTAQSHAVQISVQNDDLIVSFQNAKSLRDISSLSNTVAKGGPYGVRVLSGILDALEVRFFSFLTDFE